MDKLSEKFRKEINLNRKRKRLTAAITGIGGLFVFFSVYVLILPALALEDKAYCGIEAHQHGKACYQQVLTCDKGEHTHTDQCYDEDGNLTCEEKEHTHSKDCYENELICGKEKHIHNKSCYSKPEPEEITKDTTQIQEEINEGSTAPKEDKTDSSKEKGNGQKKNSTQRKNDSTKDDITEDEKEKKTSEVSLKSFLNDKTGIWMQKTGEDQDTEWEAVDKDTLLSDEDLLRVHLAFRLPKKTVTDAEDTSLTEYIYKLPEEITFTKETAEWHNDDINAVNQVITGTAVPGKTSSSKDYLAGKYQLIHDKKDGWKLAVTWDPYIVSENRDKAVNVWAELYITGAFLRTDKDIAASGQSASSDGPKIVFAEKTKTRKEISVSYAGMKDKKDKKSSKKDAKEQDPASRTLTYKGNDYSITVSYGKEAKLPENVELNVREIREDSAKKAEQKEYDNYYRQAESAVRENQSTVTGARFFDITFMDGLKEIEPAAPVSVKIEYEKAETIKKDEDVVAVHLPEKADNEVLDTDIVKEGKGLKEVEFSADSFSVYGIVYTVDFSYEVNGKVYGFSMQGADTVSLRSLVEALHVYEKPAEKADQEEETQKEIQEETSSHHNETEAEVSFEDLKDNNKDNKALDHFMADIESVTFSDESLLVPAKVEEDSSAGKIKRELMLFPSYPLGLSESEVLALNAKEYYAGDWILISLKAFDTEETLTVNLRTGDCFEIKVTDAQDAQMDGDKVQTITNPSGTTIDLFDYWIVSSDLAGRDGWGDLDQNQGAEQAHDGQVNGTGNNKGINSSDDDSDHGHALKFSPAWAGTVYNGNKVGDTGNAWESVNMDGKSGLNSYTGNGNPFQGIVTKTLVNDYPQLTGNNDIGTTDESLRYLFDPSVNHAGKASYPDVNQLLYVDREGYYTYDSRDYAAAFDPSNNTFTVTEQTSNNTEIRGFWPFGTQNFWTGMHINTEFSIPRNGQVLNPLGDYKDMQFEFSGDDDTWLYVDGVLVGDGGGIHNRTEIDINFATGKVTVTGKKDSAHTGDFEETKYLDDIFRSAGKFDPAEWEPIPGDESHQRFKANTYHTFDMFYLERGGGESNLYIHYNLVSTTDFTAHKSFNGQDSTDVLKRDQFQFELIGFDGRYDADGNLISGTENEHAIMPLNGNEDGNGTVASPKKTHVDGNPGYTSLLTGDTEDGNINFGNVDVNGFQNGYTYRYMVREIIPDDAINEEGVRWDQATDEQKAVGEFTKDHILYDTKMYYFTRTVRPVDGEPGKYEMANTIRYTDSSYTTVDTETSFNSFENTYKPDFGDVQFTKVNIDREPITGAEFSLFKDEQCTIPAINVDGDKQAWKAVSIANGNVSFNDVRIGTYYMKETAAPEGYALDNTVYKVIIENKNNQTKQSKIIINGDESGEAVHSVINTPEGEIKVVKKWLNSSGNETDGGNKTAKLKLYRKTDDSDVADPSNVSVVFHRDGAGWDLDCGNNKNSVIVESAASFEITWHLGNSEGHYLHDMKVNGIPVNQENEVVDLGIAKVKWIPWDGSTSRLVISDIKEDLNIEYNSNCDWFSEKPKVENLVPYTPPQIDTTPVFVESFDLNTQNSFNKTWTTGGTLTDHDGYNLPAADDLGYRYLYFVKETDADGNEIEIGDSPAEGYYLNGYSYNNSTGISDQGVIFVYNKAEEPETVDVNIKKTDDTPNSNNYLAGAVFELHYRENSTQSWVKANTIEGLDIEQLDADSRFTVPMEGITLTGLKDGQYRIEEISPPPEGYVITEKYPVVFTVANGEITSTEGTITKVRYTAASEVQNALFIIPNTPGAALPNTGGSGTRAIYLLGILLAITGGFALLTLKKIETL